MEPLAVFKPGVLISPQISWSVLDKLADFKALLATCSGGHFLHLLEIHPEGRQSYGWEYFVVLEGILNFWSDVIDIQEWSAGNRTKEAGVLFSIAVTAVRTLNG